MLNRSILITHSFTVAVVTLLLGHSASAADGVWTLISGGNATGTWSTAATGSWAGGIVADGSGSTANFSTLDVSGGTNSTITLSGSRTIGNLIFGDTNTATANIWVLTGSNTLTLAGGTPTITHNASGETSRAAVNVILAGSSGLTKTGVGTVSLGSANTYTGGTTISDGRLRARNNASLGATSGAVTVASGAGLEMDNSVTVANAINLNGSSALAQVTGTNTLSGTVNLQSASKILMTGTSGTLSLSGPLNMGVNQLTVDGAKTLILGGTISGSGVLSMIGAGGATTITNNNSATYSGQIQVGRNTLNVGHDGALGTGGVLLGVNDQASGIQSTNTSLRTLANAVTLTGNASSTYNFGSVTAGTNGDLTFTDTTAIALGTTRKFQVYNRTQFDAGFTGGFGITQQTGTGTLVLNGANTYTGATNINAGKLIVDGNISTSTLTTVNNTGTLGGIGTVGALTAMSGGTVSPGNSAGILSAGNTNLQAGSTLALELGGTSAGVGYDRLNVTGSATLGGLLNLTVTGTYASNDLLFLLVNDGADPISGTFSNYAEGDSFTLGSQAWKLTYLANNTALNAGTFTGGNDVALMAIPEPNAALLVGGLGMLALLRRRRA